MRHLRLLLTFLSVCAVTMVSATNFLVDGIRYNITDASEQTVTLTGWDSSYFSSLRAPVNPPVGIKTEDADGPVELVIPWRVLYNGIYYRVTGIGEEAFADCRTLQSVTIPNSVETIGEYAFQDCINLHSVKVQWINPLPIDESVFEGVNCQAASLYVLSGYKEVYEAAPVWQSFGNIYTYYDVDVNMWFKDPHAKMVCVDNWDTNGDGELSYREAQAVTDLGAAFVEDTELTSFTELRSFSGLTSIGPSSFQGCTALQEVIIANKVTSIGQEAFAGCSALKTVTFQTAQTSIGHSAFAGCTSLNNVTLPSNLVTIGEHAFDGCTSMTTITIPSKVSTIGDGAFANCTSMASFYVNTNNKTFVHSTGKTYVTNRSDMSVVYAYAIGASNKTITFNSSVREIRPYAFQGAKNITQLTLTNVVTVGNDAFSNCPNLYTIFLPETVASIGTNAFAGVAKGVRVEVAWPTPLDISAGTFSNFESVEAGGITGRLFVPAGTRGTYASAPGWDWFSFIEEGTIADYAKKIINFADAKTGEMCINAFDSDNDGYLTTDEAAEVSSIGTIFQGSEIGSFAELKYFTGLIAIDDNAFTGSTLTSVTLPESVETIGDNAFANCPKLTTFNVPAAVNYIGNGILASCSALKTITVSADNQNYIGASSGALFSKDRSTLLQFPANAALTSVYLPDGVKTIAPEAFKGATKLQSINLSVCDITSIGDEAFSGCTSLNNVKVGWAEPLEVNANIFNGVNLTSATLEVPLGVEALYKEAPVWKNFGTIATFKSFVAFVDPVVESVCLAKWDTNGDGKISIEEASAVTSLDNAFEGNTLITSFDELAEFTALTSLPDNAFKGCSSLINVTLPAKLASIGSSTFEGCSMLGTVTLPATVTTIGERAFYACDAFTSVYLPPSVKNIGGGAFGNCASLKSFYVNTRSAYYRVIGSILFTNDSTTVVQFPAALNRASFEVASTKFKNIAPYAFSGARYLKTVVFNSAETIGEYAFEKCQGITSITIGDHVKSIGDGAFSNCNKLYTIMMPQTLTTIDPTAFTGMPKGVRVEVKWPTPLAISDGTFSNFETVEAGDLTGRLFVPAGTRDAYASAPGWKWFSFIEEGTIAEYANKIITFADAKTRDLCVSAFDKDHDGYLTTNEAAAVTSLGSVFQNSEIGSFAELQYFTGLTTVNANAFNGSKLTSVTLPESVMYIGENAFANCPNLTTFNVPAGVEHIGNGVLASCAKLKTITVSDGNQYYIGSSSGALFTKDRSILLQFPANAALTSIYLPDGVKAIAPEAFKGASKLQSVNLSVSDITSIGKEAFAGCTSLNNVKVGWATPLEVTSDIFSGVDLSKATLEVPNGVEALYKEAPVWKDFGTVTTFKSFIAFQDPAVENICLTQWDANNDGKLSYDEAAAVTSLGNVFQGNTEITSFAELAEFTALTAIPESAFNGCTSLTNVTLPSKIASIGSYAFEGCSMLSAITLPTTLTTIGFKAFYGCESITTAYIPVNVTSIGNGAFGSCSSLKSFSVNTKNTAYRAIGSILFTRDSTTVVQFPAGISRTTFEVKSSVFKSIAPYAFSGATNLKSMVFNSARTIGERAFEKCLGLTSIVIGDNITSIGDRAFSDCENLQAITLPTNVASIGSKAFNGMPAAVRCQVSWTTPLAIPANTFSNFETLANDQVRGILFVPQGSKAAYEAAAGWDFFTIVYEGSMADYDATLISFADPTVKQLAVTAWDANGDNQLSYEEAAAVKSLGTVFTGKSISTFNELQYFTALTEVSDNAFKNTGLTAVTMPEGITRIGNSAFQGTAISKWNTLPGLKEIGDSAFAYNTGFTALTISSNITKLGTGAFKGCPKLTSIGVQSANPYYSASGGVLYNKEGTTLLQFPAAKTVSGDFVINSSVTAISEDAFLMAKNLTSVSIPLEVTSIGQNAFRGCSALENVTVEWHNPLAVPANTFEGVDVANATLTVPKGTESAYRSAAVWKNFGHMETYLDDVSVLDFEDPLVKSICVANYDLNGDGELTVGEAKTATKLSTYFRGQDITKFNELKYFTGLTAITSRAFNDCAKLEELTMPESIKEIAYAAFNGCSSLKTLEIPAAVTVININGAFPNCSSLQYFTVARGNTRFCAEDGVLFDASKTTLVAYPGGKAGEYTVPASVNTIRSYAFCGAPNITKCHLPKTLKAIPEGAFDKCTGLTYINIPATVATIGNFAFYECPSLSVIKVGRKAPLGINANVFQNTLTDGIRLYVPAGSKYDYMGADVWKAFGEYIEYPNCDVNADGFADMLDVVDILKYVINTPVQGFDEFLADFDDDEYVTVADAVILVGMIADGEAAPNINAAPMHFTGSEDLTFTMSSNDVVSFGINSPTRYTAFQFDLTLPEGGEVELAQLSSRATRGHQLLYNKIGENTYRFAALSLSNAPFSKAEGAVVDIQTAFAASNEVKASNIKFVTPNGTIHSFDNVEAAMPTGIVEINTEAIAGTSHDNDAYYNLNGVKVERPGKGVYIVNGKKVIIK